MAFTAADLKRQLGVDSSDAFKAQLLGRFDAKLRAQRADALAIRDRLTGQNDAGSRAVVAYLDALL
ncbi:MULTISPECIES: hypothetical protein [unclassified Methylobacterium]|uniref:hypothetical protein n=1 Tax=unclassified Methylobacterium TaxID=2615210 RepID=UPI00226AF7FF|nr:MULTISPECIES: hypothetical protein [unclassified Methylobacterium]